MNFRFAVYPEQWLIDPLRSRIPVWWFTIVVWYENSPSGLSGKYTTLHNWIARRSGFGPIECDLHPINQNKLDLQWKQSANGILQRAQWIYRDCRWDVPSDQSCEAFVTQPSHCRVKRQPPGNGGVRSVLLGIHMSGKLGLSIMMGRSVLFAYHNIYQKSHHY